MVIALLALLASLAALWLLWQARAESTSRAGDLERLQTRVDSLGALVQELRDPFALDPAETDSLLAPLNDTTP